MIPSFKSLDCVTQRVSKETRKAKGTRGDEGKGVVERARTRHRCYKVDNGESKGDFTGDWRQRANIGRNREEE